MKWFLMVKPRTPCPHHVRTTKDMWMIFSDKQKSTGDSEKAYVSGAQCCGHGKIPGMAQPPKTKPY
jgi:hypothetical protein